MGFPTIPARFPRDGLPHRHVLASGAFLHPVREHFTFVAGYSHYDRESGERGTAEDWIQVPVTTDTLPRTIHPMWAGTLFDSSMQSQLGLHIAFSRVLELLLEGSEASRQEAIGVLMAAAGSGGIGMSEEQTGMFLANVSATRSEVRQ